MLVKSLVGDSSSAQSFYPFADIVPNTGTHIWLTSFISLTPVLLVISAASILYRFNSESISSATAGKGIVAFFAQKKSFESKSYDFFCNRPFSGDFGAMTSDLASDSNGKALHRAHLDCDPIQLHLEDVMHERLVSPRMRQHRNQIHISIQDDQH